MSQPVKTRPEWCSRERSCQYLYNVGEICIGSLASTGKFHPWKNAFCLCFGETNAVCIKSRDLLGLFKVLQMAARHERIRCEKAYKSYPI